MQYSVVTKVLLFSVITTNVLSFTYSPDSEEQLVKWLIKDCTESNSRISCFSDKATRALERSMDWDIPLFDGIQFSRNKEKLGTINQPRSQSSSGRFVKTLIDFLNTHTLSLDLTKEDDSRQAREDGGDGGGFGRGRDGAFGGLGGGNKNKILRKEKKYMQYAFMVLLGIFGLTGPLVMKTLAVMAAKALIASKMALIIVGSVALKKIFEKDHEEPSVKVHTINTDDDHDRIYKLSKQAPYWAYEPYVKPKPT